MLSPVMPSKGMLLISEPFMIDPGFRRSVVLITEHDSKGTVGFVLNQPMGFTISEIMEKDFPYAEANVFRGGPVHPDTLHFLHTRGDLIKDCKEIFPGVYWGGDYETFAVLFMNNDIQEEEVKFFVGYSGWSAGQLVEEVKENSWIVAPCHPEDIFMEDDDLWKKMIRNLGNKYAHIANFPENPFMN